MLPFIPSLLAWGHDARAVSTFVRDLTHVLRGVRLVTVYLDGPVRPALGRAVRRESEPWLPWLIGRYAATAEPVTDLESLTGHLQRRRLLTLSVLAKYSWDVVIVEDADSRSTEDTLALVSRHSGSAVCPAAQASGHRFSSRRSP